MTLPVTPVQRLDVKVSEDVSAGRWVTWTGAYPAANGDHCAGAVYSDTKSGRVAAVTVLGTAMAIAGVGAGIAVGTRLMADTDGKLIPWTANEAHVATARQAVTAADQEFEVFVVPN